MNSDFMIENIKLKPIGSPTEICGRCPAPSATPAALRKLVRRRMSFQYGQHGVQAVRLMNIDDEEIYRWSWFQEQARREKIGHRRVRTRAAVVTLSTMPAA